MRDDGESVLLVLEAYIERLCWQRAFSLVNIRPFTVVAIIYDDCFSVSCSVMQIRAESVYTLLPDLHLVHLEWTYRFLCTPASRARCGISRYSRWSHLDHMYVETNQRLTDEQSGSSIPPYRGKPQLLSIMESRPACWKQHLRQ